MVCYQTNNKMLKSNRFKRTKHEICSLQKWRHLSGRGDENFNLGALLDDEDNDDSFVPGLQWSTNPEQHIDPLPQPDNDAEDDFDPFMDPFAAMDHLSSSDQTQPPTQSPPPSMPFVDSFDEPEPNQDTTPEPDSNLVFDEETASTHTRERGRGRSRGRGRGRGSKRSALMTLAYGPLDLELNDATPLMCGSKRKTKLADECAVDKPINITNGPCACLSKITLTNIAMLFGIPRNRLEWKSLYYHIADSLSFSLQNTPQVPEPGFEFAQCLLLALELYNANYSVDDSRFYVQHIDVIRSTIDMIARDIRCILWLVNVPVEEQDLDVRSMTKMEKCAQLLFRWTNLFVRDHVRHIEGFAPFVHQENTQIMFSHNSAVFGACMRKALQQWVHMWYSPAYGDTRRGVGQYVIGDTALTNGAAFFAHDIASDTKRVIMPFFVSIPNSEDFDMYIAILKFQSLDDEMGRLHLIHVPVIAANDNLLNADATITSTKVIKSKDVAQHYAGISDTMNSLYIQIQHIRRVRREKLMRTHPNKAKHTYDDIGPRYPLRYHVKNATLFPTINEYRVNSIHAALALAEAVLATSAVTEVIGLSADATAFVTNRKMCGPMPLSEDFLTRNIRNISHFYRKIEDKNGPITQFVGLLEMVKSLNDVYKLTLF